MPLFMDFHKGLSVTVEDVKNAHIADERVQEKYGVKYHQFWVNEDAGAVFCLMEGPDKESCEAVHREAHGNVACSIVQVEPGFYELLMGKDQQIDKGHVKFEDGMVDLGYRNIMVVAIQALTTLTTSSDYPLLQAPHDERKLVQDKVALLHGREIKWSTDDSLISVFNSSTNAVRCAFEIQKELLKMQENARERNFQFYFRIGVGAGQPVTENDEFFGEAIKLARRLCNLTRTNEVLISSLVDELCDVKDISRLHGPQNSAVKSLNSSEEKFVNNLFRVTDKNLSDENFSIEALSRDIGISRPQLYRKIVTLTGRSPNDLIIDLRMDKALSLLKRKTGNISQIALEVGYSNPSYFAKCFTKKFGCTPSKYVETARVA
ncbi:MAG TPA: nickel-binding protein [Chryseolinea sp.]